MTIVAITVTNLRRDIFAALAAKPMTSNGIADAIGGYDGSSTNIDRSLAWMCLEGYAIRAGSERGKAKRGCHAFLYQITDKGLMLFDAMRSINLRSAKSHCLIEVEL